ncbi:SWIM zinc finger family protein [Streptomyces sp. HNM0574]|uniref:SWIM zinc finger family protein n=1 Tax=Streptomyces sp. HNM0574 TaxID=2714954 RepID=UPI00146BBD0F|nr:SWIM zinc finger family protein [Streptomyces sp. HNM0574]NLU66845.1 SWIM zinc finger family protein [Streptomyces sp. HNM0574]
MTGVGVRWTAEEVLALAPDAASGRAGSRLAAPGPWSAAGTGGGAVWGRCEGGGGEPYRTVVDLEGVDANAPGYRCSCPSRKLPCKHALGLLLLWAADAGARTAVPETQEPPGWAREWLTGRRRRAGAGGDGTSSAERRARRMAAGAAELEQRLADLLHGGLAGADRAGHTEWDEIAARMVDAQAPGLASRVRELGAIPFSGSGWPERLLEECALLHLLNRALLRLDALPEPLASTVRAHAGLTVGTADVLAAGETAATPAPVRDEWLVLAQHDTEEGRLTARRIWLHGRRTGRPALLLSFGAAGRPPGTALPVGSALDATLCFYPGAPALRALVAEHHTAPHDPSAAPAPDRPPVPGFVPEGGTTSDALAGYAAALREDPWLERHPAVLASVFPVPGEDGAIRQLADAEGESALPVAPGEASRLWRLAAVSGGRPVTVFGLCGHRGFTPCTTWREGHTIPL